MKRILWSIIAVLVAVIVIRAVTKREVADQKDGDSAVAVWQAKADDYTSTLRESCWRAARAEPTDAVRAYGLLDTSISGAEFHLAQAPQRADTIRLRVEVNAARQQLGRAPVPPAAAAALAQQR